MYIGQMENEVLIVTSVMSPKLGFDESTFDN